MPTDQLTPLLADGAPECASGRKPEVEIAEAEGLRDPYAAAAARRSAGV